MNKYAVALAVAFGLSSSIASAADPTIIGNTQVGTFTPYGNSYSGFWRTNAAYSLLTDGYHTFVNSGDPRGSVFIRNNNSDVAIFSSDVIWLGKPTNVLERLTAQKDLRVWSDLEVSGVSSFYGRADFVNTLSCEGGAYISNGLSVDGFTSVNGPLSVDSWAQLNRGVWVSSGNTDYWAGEFNGGKYGIITTGTEMALEADGPAFISGGLIVGGIAQKPGGGTWAVWSDRRLKKEVTQFRTGLEAIEQVQPVRFKYNGLGGTADSNQEYVGVIAQDLEPVAPYMVTSEKKKLKPTDQALSDIKSVDPNAFTYMLVNAVKELSQQNKELKALVCQDHPTAALCRSSGKLAQKKSGLQQGLAQRVE